MKYNIYDVRDAIGNKDFDKLKLIIADDPDALNGNFLADIHEPLNYCAAHGTLDMFKLLLEKRKDVNITVTGDATPLYFAASKNQPEIAEFLLTNGAYVDGLATSILTPMMGAVTFNHPAMVKLLIQNGANVNRMHVKNGMLPLDIALSRKHKEIADYLKAHGAKTQYTLPDWVENEIEGVGILSYVSLNAGKILPVNVKEDDESSPVVQKLAFVNNAENRMLFTFGLFHLHQPKIELFLVLPEYWNFYKETDENQFPILLLSQLIKLVKGKFHIEEGHMFLASDTNFNDLKWPADIAGLFVSDLKWNPKTSEEIPEDKEDEIVYLYTLVPIKKTKSGFTKQSIERNREARWTKLTLKVE